MTQLWIRNKYYPDHHPLIILLNTKDIWSNNIVNKPTRTTKDI